MRKGGGKGKGGNFEREICKALSLWVSKGLNVDLYWRSARPNDKANHFADMDNPDAKDPDNSGKKITLLEAWKNPKTRTTDYWNRYYEEEGTDTTHRGALPFRAWEVYELLVGYARDAKLTEFICAAGCVGRWSTTRRRPTPGRSRYASPACGPVARDVLRATCECVRTLRPSMTSLRP